MSRTGFSLIELVVSIMIISIIAAIATTRISTNDFQGAQKAILSDIKYTQFLALRDTKHSFTNPKWQRKFWRIIFSTCSGGGKYYMIGSDFDNSGAGNGYFKKDEAAIDLVEGKPLWWYNAKKCVSDDVSSRIFLTKKYNIVDIKSYGGCSSNSSKIGHLGFDHMGRPHYGFGLSKVPDSSSYMKSTCVIEFTFADGTNFYISVEPESGYAHIEPSTV